MGRARDSLYLIYCLAQLVGGFLCDSYHYARKMQMSKTASGIVLLVGLLLAISAGGMWNVSSGGDLNPAHDWFYDAMTYGALSTFMLGIVMFFLGAMWFSRK